jgi:catechol 2,3-dioxygenase-like lactoylglutathione lyase family enzyme
MMKPRFRGGLNVAMKVPKAKFDETLAFYSDVLGMKVTEETGPGTGGAVTKSASVEFGPITLWFDLVENYAQAELWLELFTDDVEHATQHLAEHEVVTQDELEPLPAGLDAHWVSNPVGIPHVVRRPD